jgi:hypothetical protein
MDSYSINTQAALLGHENWWIKGNCHKNNLLLIGLSVTHVVCCGPYPVQVKLVISKDLKVHQTWGNHSYIQKNSFFLNIMQP